MIKKLQRKFILIAMLSVIAVMVLVIGSINVINVYFKSNEQYQMLEYLSQNDGGFHKPSMMPNDAEPTTTSSSTTVASNSGTTEPTTESTTAIIHKGNGNGNGLKDGSGGGTGNAQPNYVQNDDAEDFVRTPRMNAETQYKTRFFTVKTDLDGTITDVRTTNIAAVDEDTAKKYASEILNSKSNKGIYGIYKYIVVEKDFGKLVVFLDCEDDNQACMNLLMISIVIGLISLMIVFLLVSVFSRRAIKPFADSMEKQKRFITDASHEIKTPLAVISANADVLSLTDGENEWLHSIQNQTKRLTGLVNNLVSLAKMDEEQTKLTFEQFNMSDAVLDATAPFEVVADKNGKSIEYEVEPNINYNGDEKALRQLAALLVDNAVKYSPDNDKIKVKLYKKSKSLYFDVANKSESIDRETLNRLFDRFYRSDESRTRADGESTGGYGIGLSIAQAIVQAHKGKISADYKDNTVIFSAVLPM